MLKKRLIFAAIIFAVLIVITANVFLIIIIVNTTYGKITCFYEISKEYESIKLINTDNHEDIKFKLFIDNQEFEQKNNHIFNRAGLHNVTFLFKRRLTSLEKLFNGINALITIDLSQLEVEKVTSLNSMFAHSLNLVNVTFEFLTSNKIEDMSDLFNGCSSLKSVIFNFDAEKVVDMKRMFENCKLLEILNLISVIQKIY